METEVLANSSWTHLLEEWLAPWLNGLSRPADTQLGTLRKLVEGYSKTEYGKARDADIIDGYGTYAENFPIADYESLKPYFLRIEGGDYQSILPEAAIGWVMTRGTTGSGKILPITQTHLEQVYACGARAFLNFALRNGDVEILHGSVLNLNFPSVVGAKRLGEGDASFGYSSGTYARLRPSLDTAELVPSQEEIDALGPGIRLQDWHARFDLVYERARSAPVRCAMGVAPVILSFARYMKKTYGLAPKDVWKFHALFCTSVPKIHFNYAPALKKLYGAANVVEMYTATEGAFGQQIDDLPYFCPNYDAYFFEVVQSYRTKTLCQLKRGEWGKLVISSCLFPRYDIGDMIECMGGSYFRVFGRAKALTIWEHRLYRLLFGWFL